MTIGIIFTSFGMAEYLSEALEPWIKARRERLGGHDWLIAAVSVPFEGFEIDTPDATQSILQAHYEQGNIDWLLSQAAPLKETEARGAALKWLVSQGIDLSWIADGDEFPTRQDIVNVVTFVGANVFVSGFKLALRNCVFTRSQWLAEPFTPMRIHRVHAPGGYKADSFYDDNNVRYWRPWEREKTDGQPVMDVQMATMTIPKETAWVLHLSWLSNQRSKNKIRYQLEARKWPECSFRWDDASNQLAFNEAYYQCRGLPLPEVCRG